MFAYILVRLCATKWHAARSPGAESVGCWCGGAVREYLPTIIQRTVRARALSNRTARCARYIHGIILCMRCVRDRSGYGGTISALRYAAEGTRACRWYALPVIMRACARVVCAHNLCCARCARDERGCVLYVRICSCSMFIYRRGMAGAVCACVHILWPARFHARELRGAASFCSRL